MAQKKQRLWVELEIIASSSTGVPGTWRYELVNPRRQKIVELGMPVYMTPKQAISAGLAYLRATYNTGKRK